jgi:hypothetical protein
VIFLYKDVDIPPLGTNPQNSLMIAARLATCPNRVSHFRSLFALQ